MKKGSFEILYAFSSYLNQVVEQEANLDKKTINLSANNKPHTHYDWILSIYTSPLIERMNYRYYND